LASFVIVLFPEAIDLSLPGRIWCVAEELARSILLQDGDSFAGTIRHQARVSGDFDLNLSRAGSFWSLRKVVSRFLRDGKDNDQYLLVRVSYAIFLYDFDMKSKIIRSSRGWVLNFRVKVSWGGYSSSHWRVFWGKFRMGISQNPEHFWASVLHIDVRCPAHSFYLMMSILVVPSLTGWLFREKGGKENPLL